MLGGIGPVAGALIDTGLRRRLLRLRRLAERRAPELRIVAKHLVGRVRPSEFGWNHTFPGLGRPRSLLLGFLLARDGAASLLAGADGIPLFVVCAHGLWIPARRCRYLFLKAVVSTVEPRSYETLISFGPVWFKLSPLSAHEITHLIHAYGLVVVFLATGLQALGLPIPGGTALVVAGIDASTKHGLPVVGVVIAGALGALIGGTAGFALGRWRGEAILLRLGRLFRQKPERVQSFREDFQRHAIAPLFIARFITAVRNLAGLLAGSSGMALFPFVLVTAAAAIVWSTVITLEYYFAGHVILGAPTWLQILLIIVGLVATVVSFRLLRPGGLVRANPRPDAPSPVD